MEGTVLKEEKYIDIEDLIRESLSDTSISDDKEDLILEYLCQEISRTDDYASIKRRADEGNEYAYIQLASWHIANAENVKDYCLAFEYASKAVRVGYMEAYYILGQLYYYGVGCEKDMGRAIKCFRMFVNHVPTKELLNEAVLTDAYLKLAESEKQMGRFDKCLFYYNKLRDLDKKYDDYVRRYEEEIREKQKEYTAYFIVAILFMLAISGVGYFLYSSLAVQVKDVMVKYPDKQAVTIVEDNQSVTGFSAEDFIPAGKIRIEELVKYRIVSEKDFMAMGLGQIEEMSADSSSEYKSKSGKDYSAGNLLDGDSETLWQEGEEDAGIDQSLSFTLKQKAIVSAIRIENGKQTSVAEYYENNRVASFELFGQDLLIELQDSMAPQYIILENPIMVSIVELKIKSVFTGTQYNDTCITEISFYE